MDVRCEKCQTEYELDESKLKPGGVTVKCTTCGHMFKVRGPTSLPAPPAATPPPDVGSAGAVGAASPSGVGFRRTTPTSTPMAVARPSSVLDPEDGERTWLVRLEDGEIKTCRELSTLQKWIVSGRVSRSCAISRTGKKWKLLGEIGELASFFAIADEARDVRESGSMGAPTRERSFTPDPDRGSSDAVPTAVPATPSSVHPRAVPRRASSQSGEPRFHVPHERGQSFNDRPTPPASELVAHGQPSYAEVLAAELKQSERRPAAASGNSGPYVRTLPLGGAASPPRSGKSSDRPTQDAKQMPAQAPPLGYDLPLDAGDSMDAGERDGERAPGSAPAAEPSAVLGTAPTLPPYGAGVGAGVTVRSGSSSRSGPVPAGLPLAPPPSRPPASGAPEGPTTGSWAARGNVGRLRDHGPTGPTGGQARAGQAPEAAFVGGARSPTVRGEFESERFRPQPYSPTDFADDEPLVPARNRTGLWVILFSLFVLAGAAGVVYLVIFRNAAGEEQPATPTTTGAGVRPVETAAAAPQSSSALPETAPSPEPTAAPAAPVAPPAAAVEMDKLIGDADTALLADSQAALEPLAGRMSAFASGPGGKSAGTAPFLVARARVEEALAQQVADQAKLASSPVQAKKLTNQARARARAALRLAQQAVSLQAEHPGALLVIADAQRLDGARTVEVERWLRRARQNPAAKDWAGEADLVLALLRMRDNRLREARGEIGKLIKSGRKGDLRPLFRLAWIEYLYGNAAEARSAAEAVLKVQPDHAGARSLLDKLASWQKQPVATADPMPPAAGSAGKKPDDKVAGGGAAAGRDGAGEAAGREGGAAGSDSFDTILARADKLAENGNCAGAMPLYRKVLDMHPASVEALTGLGYCHMDRREFASAHARFRAALGISSRYQPAMWGIAEAYQQQGLKQQALERFEAFLAEHPTSSRASAARTRIDNLKRELGESGAGGTTGSTAGGTTGTTTGGTTGSGSGTTPPGAGGGNPPQSGGSSPDGSGGDASGGGGSSSGSPGGGGADSSR